jgi:acetyl-CoA synthetase
MRVIYPPEDFVKNANVRDPAIYSRTAEDWKGFWEDFARELHWYEPWDVFLDESKAPYYRFFVNGKINAAYNCIDRHLEGKRTKAAVIWEGEDGAQRVLTYQDLYREVCRLSNALKELGVERGDRVAIFMPNVPETVIAMLACARIGAVHVVVFEGFSARALAFRLNDSHANFIITCDGYYRRGEIHRLKDKVDEALKGYQGVKRVIVVKRLGIEIDMLPDRDHWWDDVVKGQKARCEPEIMDANDPLFIMYTSGAIAEPKGVVHSTGGFLVHVYATTKMVLDLKDNDVLWCTAEPGWITGHSYVVYGPLSNGGTVLIYEGAPDHPHPCRVYEIIEKYSVSVFYTVPTLIRMLSACKDEEIEKYDLSSLRLLGSVGEPIEPDTWLWFYRKVGKERCPIVDTWWQTETGGHVISPLPALTPMKPGSVTKPLPGFLVDIVDDGGKPTKPFQIGNLVIKRPFPGIFLNLHADPRHYVKLYWSRYGKKVYYTGDAAYRDDDGYIWVIGRVDDVLNISGHRVSTVEVEHVIMELDEVKECAVIGIPDRVRGFAIGVFAITRGENYEEVAETIMEKVKESIGSFAKPSLIVFTPDLPRTEGRKVVKRALSEFMNGRDVEISTLTNPEILRKIKETIKRDSRGVYVIK